MILDLGFKNRAARLLLLLSVFVLISAGCSSRQPEVGNKQSVEQEKAIQVRQKVEGDMADGLFNIYLSENKTALDLLKMGHTVETKTFRGIGEYVTSVNGQKEDTGKNFWAFYVNNKQAIEGASTYKPVDKDYIEWKLEKIK